MNLGNGHVERNELGVNKESDTLSNSALYDAMNGESRAAQLCAEGIVRVRNNDMTWSSMLGVANSHVIA